ncbi:MAG: amidase [Betaproteobacteria bacterium]|nr:amidase [Betaproteobacteria bacterium]
MTPDRIDCDTPEDLGIAELVHAFRDKRLSPVDVVNAQLARIRARNPVINAFVHLDEAGALRSARAAEARWQRGEPLGALDGVTFTAKDNLPVKGYPSRRGSLTTSTAPMTENSPIVARCLESGAVFLGLTTLPEFAMGPITISPLTGVTRNPWNPAKQAGGSSGGAAAAVSAGFCTFAVGSDAGGSIRIPAALTGVVGYKPSGGRVPLYPPSVAGALSCNGPITHSVRDAARVLAIATRPDARDPLALPADNVDYEQLLEGGIRGWRIAMSLTLGYAQQVDLELCDAVRRAGEVLRGLGAVVEERDPPVEDPTDSYVTLLRGTVRYSLRNLTPAQRAQVSASARDILEGPDISLADYLRIQEQCQSLARRMHAFHQDYDLLITPTVAAPAFAAERYYPEAFEKFANRRAWTPFTALFNLTQQPAISVPAGLTGEGLPVALHIVGPRAADAKVLRAAHAYEAVAGYSQLRAPKAGLY